MSYLHDFKQHLEMSCLLQVTVCFPYKLKKKKKQKGKFIAIALGFLFVVYSFFFFFWKIPRNLGSIDLKLFKEIEKIEEKYERGKCVTVYLFTVFFFLTASNNYLSPSPIHLGIWVWMRTSERIPRLNNCT